jgi:isocitrate dehydrogenase
MDLFEQAEAIEHALYVTLAEGRSRTGDIIGVKRDEAASTTRFTEVVIGNLGRRSSRLKSRPYRPVKLPSVTSAPDMVHAKSRRLVGVDVFVDSPLGAMALGRSLEQLTETAPLKLKIIANRGVRVYPPSGGQPDCVDHWRCRFVSRNGAGDVTDAEVLGIIERVGSQHRWVHVEKLHEFDGKPGFTKAQGEE